MQIILLEANSLDELEEKVNSSIRKSDDSLYEIVDIKFIPIVRDTYIYYFAQITYKNK